MWGISLSVYAIEALGNRPGFEPELKHLDNNELIAWRKRCLEDLTNRLTKPVHFYVANNKL